jgi:NAD(P)-dependent dehydrogenase (short-subunit alcohol dehydrogenase family)
VAVLDINTTGGHALVHVLNAMGEGIFIETDVSKEEQCAEALKVVKLAFGRVDFLVNSAVSFIAKGLDVTRADWQRSLGVNVVGCANMVKATSVLMKESGGGAVVNLASISGYIAQPNRWTYNATKGAILSMSRCQALDLAAFNIRVNTVSPGWTWTPEVDKAAGGERAKWEAVWGRFHMLRRCAEPREIARAILFLCSSDASFITGTDLAVDGGYLGLGSEGLGDTSSFAGSE